MGLFKKGGLGALFERKKAIDEEFFEELEEQLILADTGFDISERLVDELRTACKEKKLRDEESVREELVEILAAQMEGYDPALQLNTHPSVILVVGVNGVGKTTSIGKMAGMLMRQGKSVLLAAADTFRAAASEQLNIWAERVGADIVRHGEGGDPGAVVFDSIAAAKARNTDVIIVDTAGRLHNKQNLMNELSKIRRIIDRELPDASIETLLVIDATTGQNGLLQAESFAKAAGITGIILTKVDGTAKGGIVMAVKEQLEVGVKLMGIGEGVYDMLGFDAHAFAEELLS